ncbi:MAG: glycoside hydrolase family 9 protein [Phormidesmis sp.]
MDFANFSVENSWDSGFVGRIQFKNITDKPLNGWQFQFVAPFEVKEIWGADIVQLQGNLISVKPKTWNRQIAVGDDISFGFVGEPKTGSITDAFNQPRDFSLNGSQPLPPVSSPPVSSPPVSSPPVSSPPGPSPTPDEITPPADPRFSYGEALQKSFLFYEAQRAGDLPADNRIDWRGDSTLKDGADVGRDLSGGYFDAGDTVKFGMPMTSSMTLLAWGVDEYKNGYQKSGQLDEALDAIKWGTDYLLNAHVAKNGKTQAFYGQVGLGDVDHSYFGRVEDMDVERPAFKIDAQNPGTDLAAEAAASLAAAAMLFQESRPGYSNKLLKNAKQLYRFADEYRGRYSDSIQDADKFYKSWDGYEDELAWGATWLYKATGDQQYLDEAESNYDGVGWTQSWGDKNCGTSVLLAQEKPGNARYRQDAETWLNNWTDGNGGVKYTPGGFAWLTEWGSTRMAANAAFIAGVYSDTVTDPQGKYAAFAEGQIDYLLGDNPNDFSYMVGFGDNYAKQPHHRNATGTPNFNTPADNLHTLYGALVGGPTRASDDAYRDVRSDYVANEVALDYNAGFTGALARMYENFGGDPLSNAELDSLPGISVPESGL